MKNKDLKDERERAMKIISERALQRKEIAPAEALQGKGLWHLVASEGGLHKGNPARKGEHERWQVKGSDHITQ